MRALRGGALAVHSSGRVGDSNRREIHLARHMSFQMSPSSGGADEAHSLEL